MPYLKLKIVSSSEIGQNDNYSFTHLGGSIGRSDDCDWTLLDSDRFVSKKHLVISFRNQQFILTDVSSNGVIINSASEPLGRGNEHIFQVTDTLVIGKHVVQVEDINCNIDEVFSSQTQHDDNDLFGLVMGTNSVTDNLQEPVQDPQALFQAPENSPSPDIFADLKSESELGLGDILSAPVKSSAAEEFSNFDEQSNPFNVGAPSTPFNVTSENNIAQSNVKSDDGLIPDDWEMFDSMSPQGEFQSPMETDIPAKPFISEQSFETLTLTQPEMQQSAPEYLPESHTPTFNEEPIQIVENDSKKATPSPPQVKPIHQEISPQNSNDIQKSVSAEQVSAPTNDDFFTSLYEKLGLSKEFKATINKEAFAEDIATILLSTTQGLMSLLASRTAFKQESRLSSTLIQPRSNNPIKFSIDPVDTLEMLLVKKKKGYMSVGDSYDEAMEDIQLHQMAFMSGLQGTLEGVLGQLDPEDIENQVSKKKSQRFMGLNTNSQCWQIYKEKQPLLAKSVKENLNEVLGTYFSEAYQSQINHFKNDK